MTFELFFVTPQKCPCVLEDCKGIWWWNVKISSLVPNHREVTLVNIWLQFDIYQVMSDTFILRIKSEILEQKSSLAVSLDLMWTMYLKYCMFWFSEKNDILVFFSRNSGIPTDWVMRSLTLNMTWIAFIQLINLSLYFSPFPMETENKTEKSIDLNNLIFHYRSSKLWRKASPQSIPVGTLCVTDLVHS